MVTALRFDARRGPRVNRVLRGRLPVRLLPWQIAAPMASSRGPQPTGNPGRRERGLCRCSTRPSKR
jgi:hypothetical protein